MRVRRLGVRLHYLPCAWGPDSARVLKLGFGHYVRLPAWGPPELPTLRMGSRQFACFGVGVRTLNASAAWGPDFARVSELGSGCHTCKRAKFAFPALVIRTPTVNACTTRTPTLKACAQRGPPTVNARITRTPTYKHAYIPHPNWQMRQNHNPSCCVALSLPPLSLFSCISMAAYSLARLHHSQSPVSLS